MIALPADDEPRMPAASVFHPGFKGVFAQIGGAGGLERTGHAATVSYPKQLKEIELIAEIIKAEFEVPSVTPGPSSLDGQLAPTPIRQGRGDDRRQNAACYDETRINGAGTGQESPPRRRRPVGLFPRAGNAGQAMKDG